MRNYLTCLTVAVLAACTPGPESVSIDGFQAKLFVAAASPDYQTSDVVFVGDTEDESDVVIEQRVHTTDPGDIAIAQYQDNFYRLGRYGFDNITQIKLDAETSVVSLGWQFSILGDDSSANPLDMVFISEDRAYLSRQDSGSLWLVDPTATNEADFFISEIDLSGFSAGATSVPHMSDMILVGNKLFVVLTRLTGFSALENSAVAVINTATNQVIDTDTSTIGTQIVDLPGRNASEVSYLNNKLYIVAAGDAYNSDDTAKYSGGIYSVDVSSYAVETVLDDGDSTSAPYGNLVDLDVASNGDIYFVGRASWGDDKVYVIEVGQSEVDEIDLGDGSFNVGDIRSNALELYVGTHAQSAEPFADAGISVISRVTHSVTKQIATTFNPTQIIVLD
jgi:hypothetical protein